MSDPTSASPGPLRVLVVDSDDRIRESLARLLPIGGRCLVVGSAGQPAAALDLVASIVPDVVVVDSRVPELTTDQGFFDRVRALAPDVRILVLKWTDADGTQTRLPGADAYIRKTFRPQELIDAVVNAASGSVA